MYHAYRTSDEIVPHDDVVVNRFFYIQPFNALSTNIRVNDITEEVEEKQDPFKAANKLKLKDQIPRYTFRQPGWFKPYALHDGDSIHKEMDDLPPILAEWKASRHDMATQKFSFPENSPHSSHNLTMSRQGVFTRHEYFVHDSITYTWKFNSNFARAKMTLYKKIGQEEKPIARFAGPVPYFRTCGCLAVDDREIDIILAILTCCGMLRKDRQRN